MLPNTYRLEMRNAISCDSKHEQVYISSMTMGTHCAQAFVYHSSFTVHCYAMLFPKFPISQYKRCIILPLGAPPQLCFFGSPPVLVRQPKIRHQSIQQKFIACAQLLIQLSSVCLKSGAGPACRDIGWILEVDPGPVCIQEGVKTP